MNKKQVIVLILGVLCTFLAIIFTPRYKIIAIDSKNYIKTEQTSPLYKRSKGDIKLHWEKIAQNAGIALVVCGILLFRLRKKNG